LNWRNSTIEWYEGAVNRKTVSHNASDNVQGSVFAEESVVNDGLIDSVGWFTDSGGLQLVAAELVEDSERDVTFTLATVRPNDSAEPTDGLVLDASDGKRVLLLLVGVEVLLVDSRIHSCPKFLVTCCRFRHSFFSRRTGAQMALGLSLLSTRTPGTTYVW